MKDLAGYTAVVTGAASGIGRAIALVLAHQHVRLYVVDKDAERLQESVSTLRELTSATDFLVDLAAEESFSPLVEHLKTEGKLDILVHAAGLIRQSPMATGLATDLDLLCAVNVRAPYVLTQRLLSFLTVANGQIVFINSSVGVTARQPDVGQYAATKHALKAIADSFREEVNPRGIRVLSVYPGRTSTPMQETVTHSEGKAYHPEDLLQPEDIASTVVHALMLPSTAEVTDIFIRPALRPRP